MIELFRNTPRWLIFIIDVAIVAFSLTLSYLVRFNFSIPENEVQSIPLVFSAVIIIRSISFLISKTYAGIIRYTSTQDAARIFVVVLSGSLLFIIINLLRFYMVDGRYLLPFSILIMEFIITIFVMTTARVLVKMAYLELINPSRQRSKVVIFGAGEAGVITKRALDRDAGSRLKVEAFIDDDPRKTGKKLEGVTIFGPEMLDEYLGTSGIENLILSVQNLSPERKKVIIEKCLEHNIKVLNVPPVVKWINGELSFNQIKTIKIEDLLGREIIKLEEDKIRNEFSGKTILITGASGSIGSELSKQLAGYNPEKLILTDQAESPLYQLELEAKEKFQSTRCHFILADIANKERMVSIFRDFKPTIVFHAAAYKHVPVMEENPVESVNTNILGTKILADLAVEYGIEKFIMISTDKAVNPSSVMGASKRIAEIYVQSLSKEGSTRFVTTRFGNVLGSNGSVIPLFRKQIESGGPITITHPDVTRYFMTIPEACQLVLEAGAMGHGGEIFLFDMGKSVKIIDLAKNMIKLSGIELGKDIQIVYTGLRPGEKLYEELLNDKENTLPTHHPQIMIAQVRDLDSVYVNKEINKLISMIKSHSNIEIVSQMKKLVPEFISINSVYEELDKKS